ncbi:S-layer homology domain-containing protein [Alkaliphilus serpentinus]|uniref:S-layer homology domain-containing protein n=1 Tax=Alkaliphilus serpentinus TaxID=1482731 RepID=A0A833HPN3_9FIRM|nr:S-layer homology domain-containing protein [Alkaliphilus serpentinus]KAB3531084.1 S-layer homology domain-containing protein [Alkaliphilus serpentinus]
MRYNKLIASLVLILMLLALPLQALASTPSSWAVTEIEKAKSFNLVTEKVLEDYTSNITREEFAELAVKLYESLKGSKAAEVLDNPFKDTSNPEVLKANSLGIVGGRGNGVFAPADPVTRQEIAVMLNRNITAAGINATNTSPVGPFADENKISDWAMGSVKLLNGYGIIGGVGKTKLTP